MEQPPASQLFLMADIQSPRALIFDVWCLYRREPPTLCLPLLSCHCFNLSTGLCLNRWIIVHSVIIWWGCLQKVSRNPTAECLSMHVCTSVSPRTIRLDVLSGMKQQQCLLNRQSLATHTHTVYLQALLARKVTIYFLLSSLLYQLSLSIPISTSQQSVTF